MARNRTHQGARAGRDGKPPTGWRAWVASARRILSDPVSQLDERSRQIRMVIEAMRRAGRSLTRDDVPRMAAALTYRTIFSLIPILVLGFLVMNAFSDTDAMVQQQLGRLLHFLNLQVIEVEAEAAEVVEAPLPDDEGFDGGQEITREGFTFTLNLGADGLRNTADDEVTGISGEDMVLLKPGPDGIFGTEDDVKSEHIVASQGARTVSDWIAVLVDRVRDVSLNAIGIVGILMLVYGSISLIAEVERCFNQVYSAPRGRSWFRRIPQYWLVITLGPALLVAGFYVGEQFRDWFAAIAGAKEADGDGAGAAGWAVKVVGHIVTVVISWVMLLLLYGLVPNTKVQLRAALVGSFVAAVTWEIGKALFREYVQGPALVSLYGSLALIPLFLLWVYVTWGVVLFGLKVSYLLQHAAWRPDEMESRSRQTIVAPSVMVAAAAHVARAFNEGRVLDAGELAAELSLEGPVLEEVLCALEKRNVLRRAEPGEEEAGVAPGAQVETWTLARPAERIAVADLVRIGQAVARLERVVAARVDGSTGLHAGHGRGEVKVDLLARIEEAQVRAVESISLADLVREEGKAGGTADGAGGGPGNSPAGSGRMMEAGRGESGEGPRESSQPADESSP